MKYGVHRLTWGTMFDPRNLRLFFEQAKEAGSDTVEFRPPDEVLNGDKRQAAYIRETAKDVGIQLLFCYGYPPGLDMRSPDSFIRQYAVEHLRRAVIAASDLGGTEIGGVLYSRWPTDYSGDMINLPVKYERTMRSVDCLRQVLPLAEQLDIRLNMEVLNRYENYLINTVEEGLAFIDLLDSDHAGLVLDVYHMNIEEEDLLEAVRSAKGRIGQFHVSEPNRNIPHHNQRIDWPAVGKVLREIGYDGTVTMECLMGVDEEVSYNLRIWRDLRDDKSMAGRIAAMKQGLLFLKEQFSGQTVRD